MLLLKAVVEHPCEPVSFYPTYLHIGQKRAIKLRNRLIQKGLLQEETMAKGRRGRPSTILVLTDEARDLLESQGMKRRRTQ
jgi:hypothetical protein